MTHENLHNLEAFTLKIDPCGYYYSVYKYAISNNL